LKHSNSTLIGQFSIVRMYCKRSGSDDFVSISVSCCPFIMLSYYSDIVTYLWCIDSTFFEWLRR